MMLAFFGGGFGGGEILLIMIVLLLLFGAKRLPEMARNLGRSMEEFRRAARDVTDEIMHADLEEDERVPPPKLAQAKTETVARGAEDDEVKEKVVTDDSNES